MTRADLEALGFIVTKQISGEWCGVQKYMFTYGLTIGIDEFGYFCRYCYESPGEAILALLTWDGEGDPPGNWIKKKGHGEYLNPDYHPHADST
jgi:hypothetical protein